MYTIFLILEHPLNVIGPMNVTLSGMMTEAKPLQPEKAELPIFVTPSGMTTEVKLEL